jgi:hypothetical protein
MCSFCLWHRKDTFAVGKAQKGNLHVKSTVKEGEARDSTRRNKGGERGKAECVIMEEEYE